MKTLIQPRLRHASMVVLLSALAAGIAVQAAVKVGTEELREAVTVEGVRAHQAALQAIADVVANAGTRLAGTSGYDASADYVAAQATAAGYEVAVQAFDFQKFEQTGPQTLEQTAPGAVTYVEGTDYDVMSQSDAGDVTGLVTAVIYVT